MNMEKMTLEEKLEYYQRQTHQLKKRRDDAIDKIEYLNGYIRELHQEINSLKSENENLKITIDARDTLIEVCEKKFRELGFIITVDDDGYVIE